MDESTSPSGRAPTSVDVARLAGVSQATVSYVLNDAPGVRISEDTRKRVRRAAASLGYTPHALARTLRTGRSGIVLMPLPAAGMGRLAADRLDSLGEALRGLGYKVVLYGDDRSKGIAAARDWAQWRPAAIIVEAGRLTRQGVRQLYDAGVATVVAIGDAPSPIVPTFVFDNAAIGACAAEHLHERGRTSIAVVMPQEKGLDAFSRPRLAGVRRVASARSMRVQPVDLAFDVEQAEALVAGWAAAPARPDAVFAYNDDYAMLVMRALQDAGFDVPGDIAVVGADDLPLGPLLRPRLSSVRVLNGPSAEAVAARIDAMVRGRTRDPAVTVELTRAEIVVRESS
ncbi:LacI family DNA-binding transcriptional regulator [Actinomadura opuntiae]|uniref:LacI family DNA-binding transcriptional regulator n=1 Tax=Actinomadura sp. OS1-43 TaxID=604315 RepID=UPI00255A782F|nr:LacI family DNA-binding transcriptional regulator [Actinomadura sp. OS1-43]MDL4816969.1 LacI family DNA-binding transcriptional regulator [Actinomadura sp. OS1-43]